MWFAGGQHLDRPQTPNDARNKGAIPKQPKVDSDAGHSNNAHAANLGASTSTAQEPQADNTPKVNQNKGPQPSALVVDEAKLQS